MGSHRTRATCMAPADFSLALTGNKQDSSTKNTAGPYMTRASHEGRNIEVTLCNKEKNTNKENEKQKLQNKQKSKTSFTYTCILSVKPHEWTMESPEQIRYLFLSRHRPASLLRPCLLRRMLRRIRSSLCRQPCPYDRHDRLSQRMES